MKVVILAGGFGTRLSEETKIKPKPMVEIGDRPILWHIMKYYASFGYKEFVIALGYKAEIIKKYFLDYTRMNGAISVDFKSSEVLSLQPERDDWLVQLVDTGLNTMTGGRIKRLQPWIGNQTFMVTYGDGVSNVNIRDLYGFHQKQNSFVTITAVRPPSRFGELDFQGSWVMNFSEKPLNGDAWINGGFMVCEPELFGFLDGDTSILERDGLEKLTKKQQLSAYRHEGFWQCMDTLKDKQYLDKLYTEGNAPWRNW
ncbi:MAG: glucose-1-phosphate cytidylyltransferase [Anaerolineaceae bacterium]|nr:glucose-1-phosphate cytidylyltransferase [Anaerolineaceae bacterium]